MIKKIKDFIENIENFPKSLLFFWGLWGGIVYTRNIIESILEEKGWLGFGVVPGASLDMMFYHYPLFYLFLFFIMLFFLYLITKVQIEKLTKITIVGFCVVILPPLVDFMVHSYGYNLGYLETAGDLWKGIKYGLNPFETKAPPGFSVGIKVEMWVGGALFLFYVLLKTRSWIKTLLAYFVFPAGIVIGAGAPTIFAWLVSKIGGIKELENMRSYIFEGGGMVLGTKREGVLYLIMVLPLILWWFFKVCPQDMRKIFKGAIKKFVLLLILSLSGFITGWMVFKEREISLLVSSHPFDYTLFLYIPVVTFFAFLFIQTREKGIKSKMVFILSGLLALGGAYGINIYYMFLFIAFLFFYLLYINFSSLWLKYPFLFLSFIFLFFSGFSPYTQGKIFAVIFPLDAQLIFYLMVLGSLFIYEESSRGLVRAGLFLIFLAQILFVIFVIKNLWWLILPLIFIGTVLIRLKSKILMRIINLCSIAEVIFLMGLIGKHIPLTSSLRGYVHRLNGEYLFSYGFYKHALDEFKIAVEKGVEEEDVILKMAELMYRSQDKNDQRLSLFYIQKVIDNKDPYLHPIALRLKGDILLDVKNDTFSAIKCYQKCINVGGAQLYGVSLIEKFLKAKDYHGAINYCKNLVLMRINEGDALLKLSEIYTFLKKYGKSEEIMNYLVEKYPDSLNYWISLIDFYVKLKRNPVGAMCIIKKALERFKEEGYLYLYYGILLYSIGRVKESIEMLKKAIEYSPEDPRVYYNLGVIYEKTGRKDYARIMYNLAIEKNPNYTPALKKLKIFK